MLYGLEQQEFVGVEVLMDNGTAFHSEVLWETLDRWNFKWYYRTAYRPSGNGIVEWNHQTIKAIAGGISPAEVVFSYNISPKSEQLKKTVPQRAIFNYQWKHSKVKPVAKQAGEKV